MQGWTHDLAHTSAPARLLYVGLAIGAITVPLSATLIAAAVASVG